MASDELDRKYSAREGRVFILHGQDYGLSGKALIGRCEGGRVLIQDYANAYPAADGARLRFDPDASGPPGPPTRTRHRTRRILIGRR